MPSGHSPNTVHTGRKQQEALEARRCWFPALLGKEQLWRNDRSYPEATPSAGPHGQLSTGLGPRAQTHSMHHSQQKSRHIQWHLDGSYPECLGVFKAVAEGCSIPAPWGQPWEKHPPLTHPPLLGHEGPRGTQTVPAMPSHTPTVALT